MCRPTSRTLFRFSRQRPSVIRRRNWSPICSDSGTRHFGRLSTVIDAAARSAADAAADRIRAEVLSKIDLIVRDAVEHETSRFLRMRR